jgi:hypothetical protein
MNPHLYLPDDSGFRVPCATPRTTYMVTMDYSEGILAIFNAAQWIDVDVPVCRFKITPQQCAYLAATNDIHATVNLEDADWGASLKLIANHRDKCSRVPTIVLLLTPFAGAPESIMLYLHPGYLIGTRPANKEDRPPVF